MRRKTRKDYIELDRRITDNEHSWTESNLLKDKNSSMSLWSGDSQCLWRRAGLGNKPSSSKIHTMPPQRDDSFLIVQQLSTQFQAICHPPKTSHIHLLKQEIIYLEQQASASQQFPKHDSPFHHYYTQSCDKTAQRNLSQKHTQHYRPFFFTRHSQGNDTIKGFIGGPFKCVLSEQKLKGKSLKSKKRKEQSTENKQNKENQQIKMCSKYELMLPYRKYFPSRFRKNKSNTMKVDEVMGRRATKLALLSIDPFNH